MDEFMIVYDWLDYYMNPFTLVLYLACFFTMRFIYPWPLRVICNWVENGAYSGNKWCILLSRPIWRI